MIVYVLTLDGVADTALAATLDTFATANLLRGQGGGAEMSVRVVGVSGFVRTAQGLTVPVRPLPEMPPDFAILPAPDVADEAGLIALLRRADVRAAMSLLQVWRDAGAVIGSGGVGTFLLAQAGLLRGREAATAPWLMDAFETLHPDVPLGHERPVVSRGVVTVDTPLAHAALALWLVRQADPLLADATAARLMPQLVEGSLQAGQDAVVQRFEDWTRANLATGFSLGAAAQAAGASTRTLARRMQEVKGMTPLAFVQDLRVERAVHLLRTTRDSVDAIAAQVGYSEGVTLRTLLRRRLGRTARQVRREGQAPEPRAGVVVDPVSQGQEPMMNHDEFEAWERRIEARADKLWQDRGRPEGGRDAFLEQARELLAIEENPAAGTRPVKEASDPGVEPLLAVENQGEFPTLTDQGEEAGNPLPPGESDRAPE